jgi:putative endonuclease
MMEDFFKDYYWVYVLQSLKDGKKYTGYTKNLPSRFEAHQNGEVHPVE